LGIFERWSETAMNQLQVQNKRTFYNILQVSDDAATDAISASYLRLKTKYEGSNDATSRNELLFIAHAYETLSDTNKRNLYDRQLGNSAESSIIQYGEHEQSNDKWYTSSKVFTVMIGVLVLVAYGLNTKHTEEKGKISVAKESVVGENESSRINAESNYALSTGSVQNVNKAIDRSAEIAERTLDIKHQEAETRKMEAESRIRINEAAVRQRSVSKKEAEEKAEKCQYMQSLINQAKRAGAHEEARALQARGC